jgi:hypothetical protein
LTFSRPGELADLILSQPDTGSLANLNVDAIHVACMGELP